MGPIYIATLSTAFSAATGAKTVLKGIGTTSFHIKVLEIALFTDGVTSSAVPATWDLFTSDETTAGTSGVSITPVQIGGRAQAHGTTWGSNFTGEGTTYTVVKTGYIPQFMGSLVLPNPLGLEENSPSDAADSIGLRINTTATVNVRAWIKFAHG